MKVWIETGKCTGAGLCELIEHRVFALGEDAIARVQQDEVPDSYADRIREASRACPGDCIRFQL